MFRIAFTTLILAAATHAATSARIDPPFAANRGFADVVERVQPGVVSVHTTRVEKTAVTGPGGAPVGPRRKRRTAGEGSGVIVEPNGIILTNHHVVDRATKIAVRLADEREFEAKLLASDPRTDLAVLQVEAQGLSTVPFGDSSTMRVGDFALAIGNPFGIGQTVTLGIISATGRGNLGIGEYEDFLQTDAAINPGSSGGALVNTNGELIGINTAILSPEGASNGVGFAIPSNLARNVLRQLLDSGKVSRGYFGVVMQPLTPQLAEALGMRQMTGALVADLDPESPAAAAGIRKGDAIIGINGKTIADLSQLKLFVGSARPGSTLRLRIARGAEELAVESTLIERRDAGSSVRAEAVEDDGLIEGAELAELTAPIRRELNLDESAQGVVVTTLDPASEAAEAGLRPGDVIQSVDRKAVAGLAGLRSSLAEAKGKTVLVEAIRAGSNTFLALPKP